MNFLIKSVASGLLSILVIGIFVSPLQAQEIDNSWPWEQMLAAGGYSTTINGVNFNFAVTLDNTMGGTVSGDFTVYVTVNGGGFAEAQTFILFFEAGPSGGMFIFTLDGQAFLAWMNPILDAVNALGGDVGNATNTVPSNPVAGQAIRNFRALVFSETVPSRAETKDREEATGGNVPRMPTEISSDVEYEFFKFYGNKGKNLAIRAGYARTLYDVGITIGGKFNFNNLKMDDWDESFNNSDAGLFAKKMISESANSHIALGLNFDVMLFDKDYIEDTGIGIGLTGAGRNYFGSKMLSWGSMYQYTIIKDLKAHYLSLGTMFGLPIGEKLTFSVDALGTYTLGVSLDGENLDVDEPIMLNLGGSMGFYISRAFSLNAGVKTVLLVEEYSSFEITVGSGYRF